jgi:hypothetical protein
LEILFDQINDICFDGKLEKLTVEFAWKPESRGGKPVLGSFWYDDENDNKPVRIEVHYNFHTHETVGGHRTDEVLIHEMTHYFAHVFVDQELDHEWGFLELVVKAEKKWQDFSGLQVRAA